VCCVDVCVIPVDKHVEAVIISIPNTGLTVKNELNGSDWTRAIVAFKHKCDVSTDLVSTESTVNSAVAEATSVIVGAGSSGVVGGHDLGSSCLILQAVCIATPHLSNGPWERAWAGQGLAQRDSDHCTENY